MCELDGLKAPGGGSEEVRGLAREAGRYLHELFKSKDRFAQGQEDFYSISFETSPGGVLFSLRRWGKQARGG